MSHPIVLEGGKYTVINTNGALTFLRRGMPWPTADNTLNSGVVLALVHRIEELIEENGQEVVRLAMSNDTLRQRVRELEAELAARKG